VTGDNDNYHGNSTIGYNADVDDDGTMDNDVSNDGDSMAGLLPLSTMMVMARRAMTSTMMAMVRRKTTSMTIAMVQRATKSTKLMTMATTQNCRYR
jgi:hypothetical protein